MKYFHGNRKKKAYFEGWYFKHQNGVNTLAVIPAFHVDAEGKRTASIQVITENESHCFSIPIEEFSADRRRFFIRAGRNVFCEKGISLNLRAPGMRVRGRLSYGAFTRPGYDVMGPFRFLPFMQCSHGVLSLHHSIYGTVFINGRACDFHGGKGYVEKDRGSSFPKSYLWTQCNWFEQGRCSVMASVAHVPLPVGHITGCICTVFYKGREFRLATYLGVKVIRCTRRRLVLRQGRYRLEVEFPEDEGRVLAAPVQGQMSRTIVENAACKIRYAFWIDGRLLFDMTSSQASFECELPDKND